MAAGGQALAAHRPIRVAVYGAGHAHARSKTRTLLAMPEDNLVGVCEPRGNSVLSDRVFDAVPRLTVQQMLGDPAIELIAVEARVQEGLGYAHEAVDAGKYVHLDKPPGDDLESLQNLFAKARAKQLVVQMGYQWRYHAAMRAAVGLAKDGHLGEIYMVRATINKPLSPAQRAELAVFRGGMMFEMGCHMIDRIVEVLGKPKSVWSRLRHDGPDNDDLADNTLAVLEFDRAMAEVYVAAMQPNGNRYRTFEILGTAGTATVSPFSPDGSLALDLKQAASRPKVDVPDIPNAHYRGSFSEMAKIIRHGKQPAYSSAHDLAVQETLLKACSVG
ncbi:MAG: Gfo/Idh/MocA family oxidoreductase [bacterium]|nr:Gfo/Idh/MocA family oxidoreductase [bacterium]